VNDNERDNLSEDPFIVLENTKLAKLRARAEQAIAAHSASLKVAANAGWPDDLTEEAEQSLVVADTIHQEINAEVKLLDEHITTRYGVSLADFDKKKEPKFDSSFWKAELNKVKTTGFLEEALEQGLDTLLAKFPPKWLKTQYELSRVELDRRNTMPFILIGNARQESIAAAHPLGYALFLTDLFLKKNPEIEIYDAALLVPMVAALCDRLDGIHAVKGGDDKLRKMLRGPSGEFRGRLYELLVAGRAAQKGQDVQFVEVGNEASPDLRINDLGIPLVIECKFQSQWSQTEEIEIRLIKTIFESLCSEYARKGMTTALELTLVARVTDVNAEEVLETARLQLDSFVPFGKRDTAWGTLEVFATDPIVEWDKPTRLYSPNYLLNVFDWNIDDRWDGICVWVQDAKNFITQRARLPFCLKWRLTHKADEWSKARDVMRSLQEAANQVPVGEGGCLYVGFEDSHRSALADLRTKRNIERMPQFYHRKRGANIMHLVLNRLYPRSLEDGNPDLIESCIPASSGEADEWPEFLPTTVFVPEPA
jgi:hypothetical protein